jgi:hypothetical protein
MQGADTGGRHDLNLRSQFVTSSFRILPARAGTKNQAEIAERCVLFADSNA